MLLLNAVVMMKKLFLIVFLVFILSCAQAKDFRYGIKQINNANSEYNTTMETYPSSISDINSMINDFENLRKLQLQKGQKPFEYAVGYRLLNLEAEKLFIEGQKYGNAGTTTDGFGCKQRPLIIESVKLRNSSALKGFEAVDLLWKFVEEYPEELKLTGLSIKNALFLNATFYQISKDARSDSNIINHFCPANETLEIYRQSFRKPSFVEKYNFSEDYINNLSYEEAVRIYKKDLGLE